MPKYYPFKIGGYYLYFTSQCVIEAMHVHASDKQLTEGGSAKFWVGVDGSTKVQKRGRLSNKSILEIQEYIKMNYSEMYDLWRQYSNNGFYNNI